MFDGEVMYPDSEIVEGEPSRSGVISDDIDGTTESLDVGASRRKLQSSPFLSQLAHDGCLTSHCRYCQKDVLKYARDTMLELAYAVEMS
jgi:hypothetical protein